MVISVRHFIFNHNYQYKILLILICLSFIVILRSRSTITQDARQCFLQSSSKVNKNNILYDILINERKPSLGKTIFFHETSCHETKVAQLTARQACAIESAALLNPNLDIYVLFATSTFIANKSDLPVISELLTYSNVHLRSVNLWTYAANTPIYDWLKSGKLFDSKYVLSHVSDFLRYLTLYRWGGTYLDLDVVVKQSLEKLKPNYAGAESANFVAAGVINLDYDRFGHEVSDLCLRDFQVNFNGNDWGTNGPGVITRVLQNVCKTKLPKYMTRGRCFGFKVFPINAFYAVRWWNWKYFFEEQYLNKTMELTKKSLVVHVWNKNSNQKLIKVGSNAAYSVLAEKYCPRVYRSSGEYF